MFKEKLIVLLEVGAFQAVGKLLLKCSNLSLLPHGRNEPEEKVSRKQPCGSIK